LLAYGNLPAINFDHVLTGLKQGIYRSTTDIGLSVLYLFGMKFFGNLVLDQYYWWWVIHLWVAVKG